VHGGILALLVTRTHFSISAAMGFISIFGIAVQDALLVVTYAQRLRQGGMELRRRSARGRAAPPPGADDHVRGACWADCRRRCHAGSAPTRSGRWRSWSSAAR
jgi:hypothetical protein